MAAKLSCILSYWTQVKQATAITSFLPLLLHLQVWFCQPSLDQGLNPSSQSCSVRGVQPRKGLCRDLDQQLNVAQWLSHDYKQLSSAARSRTMYVPRAPAPLCQNSCFWPWLTLAVVLKFRMLHTNKGNLLFPLAWQNLSLSVHILSVPKTNLQSHHIPTFLATLRGKGCFPATVETCCASWLRWQEEGGKRMRCF